jgi:hypothetical protein
MMSRKAQPVGRLFLIAVYGDDDRSRATKEPFSSGVPFLTEG